MTMSRVVFALRLPRENVAEYTARHDAMWPDLREAITAQGGHNFTIYAAPSMDCVFGVVDVESIPEWSAGASSELTRKWWRYMSEVMPTNPDYSPVEIPLSTVFHQP